MGEFIVAKKLKEFVTELNVSGEAYDALDKIVENIVKAGVERAKANGRKTLKAYDL